MADTHGRQHQWSDHVRDFTRIAKELVIQQISNVKVEKAEIDRLCKTVDDRLVLNLSTIKLADDELRFLKLGVAFRPLLSQQSRDADVVRSAETVTMKLERTLRVALDSHSSDPRNSSILSNNPSHANKSGLRTCLSRVARRFYGAMHEDCADELSDADVVAGQHLKRFNDKLIVEFRHGDRLFPGNLDPGLAAAFQHLKQLVNRRLVLIRKADKSRQVCVLDPEKYDQAVNVQLSDVATYLPTTFNMKHKCAARIIQCVHKFVDKKVLTDKHAKTLLLYTDKPASRHFYGLPKTHKPTSKWTNGMPPLRPICPDIRTETAVTGCFIAQYLNPQLDSIKSYFKNSYVLKDRLLKNDKLGPTTTLLTADVDSLYPSIPIQPALHRVVRKLNNKAPEFQLVVELLRIQLTLNYFEFKGQFYQQIKGLPMGKAWAPVVASIYMDEWERSLWQVLGFEPIIYVRYIDDIFAVFKSKQDAEAFVRAASLHDENIRLSEISMGRTVHFLDLQISINTYGGFETSLYRKDCDLVVLLHQRSAHSPSVKDGVILAQLQRFLRLHTNYVEAGRCILIFTKLMVRLRGLHPRRARRLWSTFLNKIRTGAIDIGCNRLGHLTDNVHGDSPHRGDRVCIPIPPAVRRRRIWALLDDLRDHFSGPQRQALHSVRLDDIRSIPIGVSLYKH
jgi:hypothetical protein